MGAVAYQPSLLGLGEPGFDSSVLSRAPRQLGRGAWILHVAGWLEGEQAVFDHLVETMAWRSERRPMYDRVVDVPRLTARVGRDGSGHPALADVAGALGRAYGMAFGSVSLALYRGGDDSVAPHGDQVVRDLPTSLMATVSLGERRRFRLTPVEPGPAPLSLDLGRGDLLVMGGTIQRTWLHSVPKTSRPVGARICVMLRTRGLG